MPDWVNDRTILLVAHIGGAILLLGPVTVATSLFPRYAQTGDAAICALLQRIARGYGLLSLLVPLFGLALSGRLQITGQGWVIASLVLFIVAFVVLLSGIVPRQQRMLTSLSTNAPPSRSELVPLRVLAGSFSLIWLVILVLMVARPS